MIVLSHNSLSIYCAENMWEKTRGVINQERLLDCGVFFIPSCNWVHSFFISQPLYIYFIDAHLSTIIRADVLRPYSLSLPVFRAAHTLEALTQLTDTDLDLILRELSDNKSTIHI